MAKPPKKWHLTPKEGKGIITCITSIYKFANIKFRFFKDTDIHREYTRTQEKEAQLPTATKPPDQAGKYSKKQKTTHFSRVDEGRAQVVGHLALF